MSAPVALVTGGAGGIGGAVVRRFAARGCRVHVLDLVAVADGHVVDVRDPGALATAVATIVEQEGRLDHVVAAAAVMEGGDALWETDPALVERLWQTDALGIWHTAAATIPHLLVSDASPAPSFVAITSAAGEKGLWHLGAYVVAKHAAVGVVRALAADLAGTRVVACGVAPGATDTDMLAATAAIYGVPKEQLAAGQYGDRLLTPDEVAVVVEAAAFSGPAVHGAILSAQGGLGR